LFVNQGAGLAQQGLMLGSGGQRDFLACERDLNALLAHDHRLK
jgi:hypothetical protein